MTIKVGHVLWEVAVRYITENRRMSNAGVKNEGGSVQKCKAHYRTDVPRANGYAYVLEVGKSIMYMCAVG